MTETALSTVTRYFRTWRFNRLTHSIDGLWEYDENRLPRKHCRLVYDADTGLLIRVEEYTTDDTPNEVKLIGYASENSDLIVEALDYNPDGSLRLVHRYEYDERGRMIDRLEWDGHHNRRGHVTLTWSDDDEELEECSYFPSGAVNQRHCYEHDAEGNLTVEQVYAPDDTLIGTRFMTYDEYGSIIEKRWHGPDGALRRRFVHAYDDMGNFTTSCLYDADGRLTGKVTYQYDACGNEIARIQAGAADLAAAQGSAGAGADEPD